MTLANKSSSSVYADSLVVKRDRLYSISKVWLLERYLKRRQRMDNFPCSNIFNVANTLEVYTSP